MLKLIEAAVLKGIDKKSIDLYQDMHVMHYIFTNNQLYMETTGNIILLYLWTSKTLSICIMKIYMQNSKNLVVLYTLNSRIGTFEPLRKPRRRTP